MNRKAKAVWHGNGRDGIGDKSAGFTITKSALTLAATIPGFGRATCDELAGEAGKNCPVSKLFNAEITLAATLT